MDDKRGGGLLKRGRRAHTKRPFKRERAAVRKKVSRTALATTG